MTKYLFIALNLITLSIFVSCSTSNLLKEERNKEMVSSPKLSLEELAAYLAELREEVSKKSEAEKTFFASDLYLKASASQMEGDYYTANVIYKELVELVPEDEFVQRKYAVSLIRAGNLPQAEKVLEGLYTKMKKDTSLGLILAGVYTTNGKVGSAKKLYQAVLVKEPANQDACIFLSKAQAQEKQFNQAIATLNKCQKVSPKDAVFSYYMGKIYLDKKDVNTAKKHFDKALRLDPEFTQAALAVGLIHEERNQTKSAIAVYEKFLKTSPEDSVILSRLVQLLFTSEEFKKVITYAERLSDLEPDNLNLKVKLGILYTDNKDYHGAISIFKSLLVLAPTSDKILYYLGAIYQEVKEYDNAIQAFGTIPEASGLYQDSTVQIANMMSHLAYEGFKRNQKEYKQAEKAFVAFLDKRMSVNEALELDLRMIKASYFESVSKVKEAVASIEGFKKKESLKESHKYYLASLYEKKKDYKRSTDLILEIVEKNPNNAHAWNFLGYSLLERDENLDLAHDYISRAINLNPEDGYIRDSLGWYYFKVGKVDKALAELKVAIQAVPDDVSIQKHLAIVYTTLKDFKNAKEFFVKAIKQTTDEKEKHELQGFLNEVEQKRVPASLITNHD